MQSASPDSISLEYARTSLIVSGIAQALFSHLRNLGAQGCVLVRVLQEVHNLLELQLGSIHTLSHACRSSANKHNNASTVPKGRDC